MLFCLLVLTPWSSLISWSPDSGPFSLLASRGHCWKWPHLIHVQILYLPLKTLMQLSPALAGGKAFELGSSALNILLAQPVGSQFFPSG